MDAHPDAPHPRVALPFVMTVMDEVVVGRLGRVGGMGDLRVEVDGVGGGGDGKAETQPPLSLSLPLFLFLPLLPLLCRRPRDQFPPTFHRLPRMWCQLLGLREAPQLVPHD